MTPAWNEKPKRCEEEAEERGISSVVETAVVLTEEKEEIRNQGIHGSGNTCCFAITPKVTNQGCLTKKIVSFYVLLKKKGYFSLNYFIVI